MEDSMYIAIKGLFDKGKITLLEDVPEVGKANVIVIFQSETTKNVVRSKFNFSKSRAFGMWKNHSDIKDETKFASELRNQWEREYDK